MQNNMVYNTKLQLKKIHFYILDIKKVLKITILRFKVEVRNKVAI